MRAAPCAITELLNLLAASSRPEGITSGSDGNLWFTEAGSSKIGNIGTAGTGLTEYGIARRTRADEHRARP